MKVYGPYVAPSGKTAGRQYVNIIKDDGRKTTMLWSRWLMQEHLGHALSRDQHVHHVDEDITNDAVDNFQVLSAADHSREHLGREAEMWVLICIGCGNKFDRSARQQRDAQKQGKSGPFCGRSCAGKYSQQQRRRGVAAPHGSPGMYRSGCHCEECRAGHRERMREYRERKLQGRVVKR